jgi:hypothetical protein
MAMMAMTTKSSIRVNPRQQGYRVEWFLDDLMSMSVVPRPDAIAMLDRFFIIFIGGSFAELFGPSAFRAGTSQKMAFRFIMNWFAIIKGSNGDIDVIRSNGSGGNSPYGLS